MTEGQLLTSGEVAAIIGKSSRTVARLAAEGKITHAERLPVANGIYLFRREDVDAYLVAQAERQAS